MSSPVPTASDRGSRAASAPGNRTPPERARARRRALRTLLAILLASAFVVGLGYVVVRHVVWPHPERWLPRVERTIAEAIGRPVQVGSLRIRFDDLHPALEIGGLEVLAEDGARAFSARRVEAVVSLRQLFTGRLRLARLDIDAPALRIERVAADRFVFAGIPVDLGRTTRAGRGGDAVAALLATRAVTVRAARLDWVDHVAATGAQLREFELAAESRRTRDGGRRFVVRRLSARGEDGAALALDGRAHNVLRFDERWRLLDARLALQRFDAARALALVAALPLPRGVREQLARLRLAGAVEHLALDWRARAAKTADDAPSRYRIEARVEHLAGRRDDGVLAAGRLGTPFFEGLTGTVVVDDSGGRLAAAGRDGVLGFPGMFADPALAFDALDVRANWRWRFHGRGGLAGLELEVEHLAVENGDAAGELSGRYVRGASGRGAVDLSGRLNRADARRVARYLPLELPEEVRGWVAGSVRAGFSDEVKFRLRGELADFPYREPGSGEFRVEAAVRDASLEPAPGWPALERMQGRIVFDRAGVDIALQSGRLMDLELGAARASIEEYREARLHASGHARGRTQDVLRWIGASPLDDSLKKFARRLAVHGRATARLALDIPLEHVEGSRLSGELHLADNRLVVDPELPAVTGLAGRIAFSENGLTVHELTGAFLGSRMSVAGEAGRAGETVALRAHGRAGADVLRRLLRHPLARELDGASDWQARVDVQGRETRLVIESDLVGLASRLPAPFGKPAAAAWPLRVEWSAASATQGGARAPGAAGAGQGAASDRMLVSLRDDVRLAIERAREPATGRMRIARGVLALAAEPALPKSGFAARIDVPDLDLDPWMRLLDRPSADPGDGAPGPAPARAIVPDELSLVADRLRVAGKEFNEIVVGATRSGESWRASVHAHEIDGFLTWRAALPGQAAGALTARLARLEIPRGRVDDFESLLDRLPKALPALDVEAERFVLGDRPLGTLRVRAVAAGDAARPVWRLDLLRIEHPGATLHADGTWQAAAGRAARRTRLAFDLALRDTGQVLDTLGFHRTMRGGSGRLSGTVGWDGSPLAIDYPTLAGTVSLELDKGQFLNAEPGIARLIGVLSLQSLGRRLSFDFRDLYAQGFAFDAIRANARMADGVARSEDFSLRALAGEARISGSVDLAAETQELLVEIRPDADAGLASLAWAALVNPAVGLGSFVAQLLLREPLQQAFAWRYTVTGSWYEPEVTRLARPQLEMPLPTPDD